MKAKKSVKKVRNRSTGQIAASRVGCPGIKMFRLDQLKPAGYNPRVIAAEAMEGLTNSISRFGCVEPIVVNTRGRKNVIVGGNQRFEALRSLGIAECLCVTISCSKTDEKLLNLTLNNPQIQGDFIKKIVKYIEKLRQELPDDNDFLNLRIADLQMELGPGKTGRIPDDDIPKMKKKAKTRLGELWILGKHRLLCGDSTKEADVSRLMNGKKATLFATDPPYFVDYTKNKRPTKNRKDWSQYREVELDKAKDFIKNYYESVKNYIQKGCAFYLWHADKRRALIDEVCTELEFCIHQQIIWVKPYIVMGYSYFCSQHEPAVLMWYQKDKPKPPKKIKYLKVLYGRSVFSEVAILQLPNIIPMFGSWITMVRKGHRASSIRQSSQWRSLRFQCVSIQKQMTFVTSLSVDLVRRLLLPRNWTGDVMQ